MDCREEFEKEAKSQGYSTNKVELSDYEDYHLTIAFSFFQACWNLRQESKPIGVDVNGDGPVDALLRVIEGLEKVLIKAGGYESCIEEFDSEVELILSAIPIKQDIEKLKFSVEEIVKDAWKAGWSSAQRGKGTPNLYWIGLSHDIKTIAIPSQPDIEQLKASAQGYAEWAKSWANLYKMQVDINAELNIDLNRKNEQIKRLQVNTCHSIFCGVLRGAKKCSCGLDDLLAEIKKDNT